MPELFRHLGILFFHRAVMELTWSGSWHREHPCVGRFACPTTQGMVGPGTDYGVGLGCGAEQWVPPAQPRVRGAVGLGERQLPRSPLLGKKLIL